MEDGLAPVAALAFVGVGLVDGVEVCAEADLARTYLYDDRADCSMCTRMCGECVLSWLDPKLEELPAVLGLLPG